MSGPARAFRAALAGPGTEDAGLLLPERLARAAAQALGVDGAGLSLELLAGRRVPLAAGDPAAAEAERLQFALGDGPCTAAHRDGAPVAAGADELHARWPVFALELAGRTPFRSVLALPVGGALAGSVVLDLFAADPAAPGPDLVDAAREVADVAGAELVAGLAAGADAVLGVPASLRTDPVRARQQVWVAVGRLATERGASSGTALAALRALAFGRGLDLETAAAQLLTGELPAD
ncbi:hypothetical protein [Klenkia taihuensis]|uniref:ANTAR domain-containing protein n=1 Tax=Klenkia taihuensis TaxID=1225127 RepID=A0A1I1PCC8_9ACTN|nr:hypothetical protein [Klenkia taihuensis]GHE11460.1 hypothetical protein GCM10011381_24870 [Klenkia taihuensis]SFD04663.1 hypothetical protein SAMN05661030_2409 [Klenkia taihuensis]